MVEFIDQERETIGVESICKVLPIAPSTYYRRKKLIANPDQRCDRAKRDEELIRRSEGLEAVKSRGYTGRTLHRREADG